MDLQNDRKGLLWILDEESVFPGATDTSFLDRVQIHHGAVERGEAPIVKVIKEDNQFVISHCQRTLPILYDANEWVRRAREHPSFRVVVNTLAASKRCVDAQICPGMSVWCVMHVQTCDMHVQTCADIDMSRYCVIRMYVYVQSRCVIRCCFV